MSLKLPRVRATPIAQIRGGEKKKDKTVIKNKSEAHETTEGSTKKAGHSKNPQVESGAP